MPVPGLQQIADFVSADEEAALVAQVDAGPWLPDLTRRVQHLGWKYDYKARKVVPEAYLGPLPSWASTLAARLFTTGLFGELPDQVIVNEYIGNQGIAKHVDCKPCFRGAIATVSLCETWDMVFRGPGGDKVVQSLERRSAVVLTGAARDVWTHELPKRLSEPWGRRGRRLSLTFRKVNASRS